MNRPTLRSLLALAAMPCAVACAHHETMPVEPEASEYTVGREDLLEIAVWKDAAMTTVAPVRPDGRVSVPMIGDIEADGKTPRQLSAEISERLSPLVKEPVVSVIVREINSSKFAVVGEVAHPGIYPLRGRVSILQAVAAAGGLTEFAARGGVVVIRRGKDGEEHRYKLDLDAVVDGKRRAPALKAGDTVYVP
jgi:polysaccharide export outer membrane protein